jgi:hypothetical protein
LLHKNHARVIYSQTIRLLIYLKAGLKWLGHTEERLLHNKFDQDFRIQKVMFVIFQHIIHSCDRLDYRLQYFQYIPVRLCRFMSKLRFNRFRSFQYPIFLLSSIYILVIQFTGSTYRKLLVKALLTLSTDTAVVILMLHITCDGWLESLFLLHATLISVCNSRFPFLLANLPQHWNLIARQIIAHYHRIMFYLCPVIFHFLLVIYQFHFKEFDSLLKVAKARRL